MIYDTAAKRLDDKREQVIPKKGHPSNGRYKVYEIGMKPNQDDDEPDKELEKDDAFFDIYSAYLLNGGNIADRKHMHVEEIVQLPDINDIFVHKVGTMQRRRERYQ
jgi:hypothetical protein